MKIKNKILSPGEFICILIVFGMLISCTTVFIGIPSLKSSFAMNAMEIDYDRLNQVLPTDKIKLYFNQPVDITYKQGNANTANGQMDFRDIIVERIANSSDSIELAIMRLFDERIINSLKDAYNRGVKIRILTDYEYLEELKTSLEGTDIEIKDNNQGKIQEGYGVQKSILHYKFGLFDSDIPEKAYLISSSANWDEKELDINPNNLLLIQDYKLVNAYLDEYEQMWSGKFNRDKDLTKHRGEIFNIDGRTVELWMSPSTDPFSSFEMRYINLFKNAKKSIYFATFIFSLPRLSQSLEEKFKEGLDVKGIVNEGIWTPAGSVINDMRGISHEKMYKPWDKIMFENLRNDGVDGESSFHYKYFIIDDDILITGASNPTTSAVFTNDEDVLIIHDPNIAHEAKQNFMCHFKRYGGLTKDSIIKISDFDDEKDIVTLENLSDKNIDLKGWKIVATDRLYIENPFFPKKEHVIDQNTVLTAKQKIKIQLPADFITDNSSNDKYPETNLKDDGEIYLYDESAHLQHMIWY